MDPRSSADSDVSDIDGQDADHQDETKQATTPVLFHKVKDTRSILTLIVSGSRIFAGTQGGEIIVSISCDWFRMLMQSLRSGCLKHMRK